MRASTVVSFLFVTGALGTPVKRDIVYEDVIIWQTVTVYVTAIATEAAIVPNIVTTTTATQAASAVSEIVTSAFSTEAAIVETTNAIIAYHYSPYHGHNHNWNFSNAKALLAPTSSAILVLTDPASPLSAPTDEQATSTTSVPILTSSSDVEPLYTSEAPISTPEATSTPIHEATPAEGAESDGSPLSDGISLLTTINKWRTIYKLPLLTWSYQLQLNALKTGTDGGGVNQIHQLNDPSMAQVITPGMSVKYKTDLGGDSPFELSYVAWLCESSSDSELKSGGKDQCKLVAENLYMYYNTKGHYEALTSSTYTHIGCAFADNPNNGNDTPYQGLWVCDLY